MSGFHVINRSSLWALSPERSGIRVGSNIYCVRSYFYTFRKSYRHAYRVNYRNDAPRSNITDYPGDVT